MKTCLSILLLILVLLVPWSSKALPADAPAPAPKPLEAADRLLVREAQLYLAQAHIARLQAEAQVRQAQDNLNKILSTLKTQYACPDCELNGDFTWIQPAKVSAKADAKTTPAPDTASGQSSDKE